jgi:hypothetical protein
MDKAAAVTFLRRPEATNAGLRVEQGHLEGSAWHVMKK